MRITHPRLANALHESTNIQTVLEKNDEDLIEYSFKSLRIEGIKKSNLSVQSCVFSNCSFGTCCIQKSQFSDVVFKNCDLSNVNLTGCGFHRVEFIGCKLMGTNMSDGIFNHITFEECRGEYMNLSMSKMRYIQITRSNLQGAGIEDCQLTNVSFERSERIFRFLFTSVVADTDTGNRDQRLNAFIRHSRDGDATK